MNTILVAALKMVGAVAVGKGIPQISGGFSWMEQIPNFGADSSIGQALGLAHPGDAQFIPAAWFMVIVVLGFAVLARMGLERAKQRAGTDKYLPDEGLSFRTMGEMITEGMYNVVHGVLGDKETKNFFPLIASFFTYILFSNLMSFIPFFEVPTGNMSSNLALGLVSFLTFNYAGLSRDPVGYFKHLAGPILVLAPVFFALETLSLCIRPLSLAFRLTVNMAVDHLLQSIARTIGEGFLGVAGQVIMPIPLFFLGLLVCFMQAFVFALLSTIYVSMSVPHGEHHEADGHH